MIDYNEACYRAALDQGLVEIVGRLAVDGVRARIDQTGGFCMVAYVPLGDRVIGITQDGAGIHPEGEEYSGEGYESIIDGGTIPEIVGAVVKRYRAQTAA